MTTAIKRARWTDNSGTTWVVGARVLWRYGRKDYAEFGAWGEVISVPSDDDDRLLVRLQPAPESQKERREVERRRRAGEDLTRIEDFRHESGLMTAPQVFRANKARFEAIAREWEQDLGRYDDDGCLLPGAEDLISDPD